jgi:1,4-alpha-glucan branching enzyme
MPAPKFFALVLHSHIPYVLDHGSWPHGMDWLYEAAAETYLPLLDVFERLSGEGIPPKVNVSFTPVLMAQLKSADFVRGFDAYLRMKAEIAARDEASFRETGSPLAPLAAYWGGFYRRLLHDFNETFGADIIGAFRALQDRGDIEVLTSAATHAYFPLLKKDASIRHQVLQGRHVYRRYFGREARGFWIPECAYRPGYSWKPPFGDEQPYARAGTDEILSREGLGYFFVDGHLLRGGEAKGVYLDRFPGLKLLWEKFRDDYRPEDKLPRDPYSSHRAYPSELPFFVRDEVSGSQVWSRDMGYPGDEWYLEFHKKHYPGGMRYWRITSSGADLALKEPYEPMRTAERLEDHASHFVSVIEAALQNRQSGIVAALYDTELFGHWWFEGPEWLFRMIKKLARSPVRPLTAGECLEKLPPQDVFALPEGSWGKGGFHWIWLNDETSWIWKRIYGIEDAAEAIGSRAEGLDPRVLRQFYREKFLLESSDWPFLVSTWTARDYAEGRASEHYSRARELAGWLLDRRRLGAAEEARLRAYESEDALFEEIISPEGSVV